jgi:hypothetical protein
LDGVVGTPGRRIGVLAACLAAPAVASAQADPEDAAAARTLFEEGRSLAAGGRYPEAADRFRRAARLRPSAAILYNLAVVLEEIGELVEAGEQLRAAIRMAPAADPVRASSEALLREVEPRIGRLTVNVDGDATDAEVLLDDRPISSARMGVAAPADPGRHVVVVRRGVAEERREVEVPEGGAAQVSVPAPRAGPPLAPISRAPAPEAAQDDRPIALVAPAEREPEATGPAWPLVAVGGALVAGGVVLDVVPDYAADDRLTAIDFLPVVLYAAGAGLVLLGVP